jgi:hypothetical protein
MESPRVPWCHGVCLTYQRAGSVMALGQMRATDSTKVLVRRLNVRPPKRGAEDASARYPRLSQVQTVEHEVLRAFVHACRHGAPRADANHAVRRSRFCSNGGGSDAQAMRQGMSAELGLPGSPVRSTACATLPTRITLRVDAPWRSSGWSSRPGRCIHGHGHGRRGKVGGLPRTTHSGPAAAARPHQAIDAPSSTRREVTGGNGSSVATLNTKA